MIYGTCVKLNYYVYIYVYVSFVHSFVVMSADTIVAPESVAVAVAVPIERSSEYWPRSLDEVRDCDLSYFNDDHSADMVRDGMRAIILTGELPEIKAKEIDVWKYLSEYSPPSGRGFQFSSGDDNIVSLVQNNMLTGHSGYSMGWTMRNIEFIAKNGVAAHRDRFLENKRRS